MSFCFHLLLHFDRGHEWERFREANTRARKEVEKKAKAFRREQIKKNWMEHVQLTKAIYVESFAHVHLQ